MIKKKRITFWNKQVVNLIEYARLQLRLF